MSRTERVKARYHSQKPLSFAYALKSFLGYLEGTEKSAHTIKNYRSDLMSFQVFLEKGLGSKPVSLSDVTLADLERYHENLKKEGFKTNTRRRKVLTVRKLLRYLSLRRKIALDLGQKLPTPHKIERVPQTIILSDLLRRVREDVPENEIQARNRVLLWTLAETGCQVSELSRIRFDDWHPHKGTQKEAILQVSGKAPRALPVSLELYQEVQHLQHLGNGTPYLFLGFNKFGSMGSPITPRGIELLVKTQAARLDLGEITPRVIRHSVVRHWLEQKLPREEIQRRLGLRTSYAFRVYEPLMRESGVSERTWG